MAGETMTNLEYRMHKGIARSSLWVLLKQTPLHLRYSLDNWVDKDSKALLFGRASHKYILEPESFFDEFVILPRFDKRTKAGKEAYAAFLLECEDKEPIDEEDFEIIKDMAKAINDNPTAKALLVGEHEKSFFWVDSETGEACKVRPDGLTEYEGKKYIIDYKTTESCADGHFERASRQFGYKFQAGMYREGMFQTTFEDYGFIFIAQEKKAPYAVRIYKCSDEFMDEGYEQFRKAIGTYHFCKVNDWWGGYETPENIITTLEGEGDY